MSRRDPARGGWSSVTQGRTLPGAPVAAVAVPGDPARIAVFLADPTGEVFTTSAAMERTVQALITLDRLHCHKHGDVGSGEPYLWTAFFKIDGDTFTLDVNDDEVLFLNGRILGDANPPDGAGNHSAGGDQGAWLSRRRRGLDGGRVVH